VELTDSGIGMTAEEVRRLFRPFAQANDDIARRFGGAGLGLALVRRIAMAMAGDLALTSKPGRGTTFRLSVLVRNAEDQSGPKKPRAAFKSKALRVLCV